jgi:hypothetical protein
VRGGGGAASRRVWGERVSASEGGGRIRVAKKGATGCWPGRGGAGGEGSLPANARSLVRVLYNKQKAR